MLVGWQQLPVKHVECRDHWHANERGCHKRQQHDSIGPRLLAMDQHRGALAQQGGIHSKDSDCAYNPDCQQHTKQYPRARPGQRAGGAEQHDRDDDGITHHAQDYLEHWTIFWGVSSDAFSYAGLTEAITGLRTDVWMKNPATQYTFALHPEALEHTCGLHIVDVGCSPHAVD